jgi:signal-transduction protein with cAMP-binding, CBS, and nucleotidyltransferase domain
MVKTGFSVRDGMTNRPVMTACDTTILGCALLMAEHNVGSLILHEKKKIKGIVTEEDIVRKAVRHGKDMKKTKVSEIMEKNLITIEPGKDIYDAILLMKDNEIRQLPVMEKDRLVGLITMKDVLKIEPQLFDILADSLEIREEHLKPVNERIQAEGTCDSCGESTFVQRKKNSLVCKNCS